jgi:hypothetical protein
MTPEYETKELTIYIATLHDSILDNHFLNEEGTRHLGCWSSVHQHLILLIR